MEQREASPLVVVTRTTPGEVRAPVGRDGRPIAQVRLLGDGAATREALLRGVRGATAIITMFHDRVDAELLGAAGPGLRAVINHAVGYDNIDVAACRARGVAVCNTPDAVTEGTANLALLLMLACARQLIANDRFARGGAWAAHGVLGMHERLGLELAGRMLLIVGAGRIGHATAMRGHALGMRCLYVARSRKVMFELGPLCARRVELEEGLREADVVSVHTPLTAETRHLIGARELGLMKDEAILINTSRGPVIDEAALVTALEAGKLWGVGLDVFEFEPRVSAGLAGCERVVMTPHVGSAERRYRAMMTAMCAEAAWAAVRGEEPQNRVA